MPPSGLQTPSNVSTPPTNPIQGDATVSTSANPNSNFFNFTEIKTRLNATIQSFNTAELAETEIRRKLRAVDVNVKQMKETGALAKDETYIPIRTIDTNISREKPPFVSYLKQPQRLMIFTPANAPTDTDCRELDKAFTKGLTYTGWELPHFKCLDGAQAHGWDFVEVEYNTSYQYNVCVEHVGHDNLIFDLADTIDIQNAEFLCRKFSVSIEQIKRFVDKYGFDPVQVANIKDKMENDKNTVDRNKTIYKLFFKEKGVVHTGWFSLDGEVTNWLKMPSPAFIGIKQQVQVPSRLNIFGIPLAPPTTQWQNAALQMYPIFPLYYEVTEDPKIRNRKGRTWKDEYKQEAQIAMVTSYVNGCMKASKIYGSPKADTQGDGMKPKQIDIELFKGAIIDKPFDFWNFPYPEPTMLQGIEYLDIQNQQETGQVNFAVNNRTDSRKTAKEVQSAENQYAQLTGVNVCLYAIYIRQVYNFVWKIVQSQALQGNINFLQIPTQTGNALTGVQTVYVNDTARISRDYDLRPAGDIDFIERQFILASMQQDMQWVSAVPGLREEFYADFVKIRYAEKGEKYAALIKQASTLTATLAGAGQFIAQIMKIPEFQDAPPEVVQAGAQILQGISAQLQPQQPAQGAPQ